MTLEKPLKISTHAPRRKRGRESGGWRFRVVRLTAFASFMFFFVTLKLCILFPMFSM